MHEPAEFEPPPAASRILILDDERNFRDFLGEALQREGYVVNLAGTARAGLQLARSHTPGLILLDQNLPDGSGLDVLSDLRRLRHSPTVILMTAFAEYPRAVEAIKAGAFHYLAKPFEFGDLLRILQEARSAAGPGYAGTSDPLPDFVGVSAQVLELKRQVVRVASSRVETVLICGESGTGKELVARALHQESGRADRRLLSVNCAALTDSLMINELFGHERGAFTDARNQQQGVFEAANGGTLFLDEISELTAPAQAALLRALEERVIRRIGGTRDVPVDVRIVAASHNALADAVAAGTFRSDLYYRLNVVQLVIPPLRERGDDVLVLAQHFSEIFAAQYGEAPRRLAADALALITHHDWPGNVRELRNAIERAYVVGTGPRITAADLPPDLRDRGDPATRMLGGVDTTIPFPEAKRKLIESFERAYLEEVLDRADGNLSRAARDAGVLRQVFQRLLGRHNLPRSDTLHKVG